MLPEAVVSVVVLHLYLFFYYLYFFSYLSLLSHSSFIFSTKSCHQTIKKLREEIYFFIITLSPFIYLFIYQTDKRLCYKFCYKYFQRSLIFKDFLKDFVTNIFKRSQIFKILKDFVTNISKDL